MSGKGIRKILGDFRESVKQLYGDRLKDIVLYGSWARGEATDESDIDLIVILAGKVIPGKEIDRMIDVITDVNLRHDTLLSVYPVSEKDYRTVNSPLLMNARREGIRA